MPNYCTNRLTLQGSPEDVAAFRDLMLVEHGADEKEISFDFERIIPMPECLPQSDDNVSTHMFHILKRDAEMQRGWEWINTYRGGNLGPFSEGILLEDAQLEAKLAAADADSLATARQMIVAERETGYTSWYRWAVDKWGTKWNSMHCRIESEEPLEIRFDTAWAPPVPVFEALAERFPGLSIHCASFDEGWGFAAEGWFNPPEDGVPYEDVDPDAAVYERVYGQAPLREEDDGDEETAGEDASAEAKEADDPDKPVWAM